MSDAAGGGAVVRVGERRLRFASRVVVRVAAGAGLRRIAGLPSGVVGILVEDGMVVPVVESVAVGSRAEGAWILLLRLGEGLMGVPVDDVESLETLQELDSLLPVGPVDGADDVEDVDPEAMWQEALGAVAGRAEG